VVIRSSANLVNLLFGGGGAATLLRIQCVEMRRWLASCTTSQEVLYPPAACSLDVCGDDLSDRWHLRTAGVLLCKIRPYVRSYNKIRVSYVFYLQKQNSILYVKFRFEIICRRHGDALRLYNLRMFSLSDAVFVLTKSTVPQ
jgi:hypothetical protein